MHVFALLVNVYYCCVGFGFFTSKARDWLGRTSPKWPISCHVWRVTLTQSVIHSTGEMVLVQVDTFWTMSQVVVCIPRDYGVYVISSDAEQQQDRGVCQSWWRRICCRPVWCIRWRRCCVTGQCCQRWTSLSCVILLSRLGFQLWPQPTLLHTTGALIFGFLKILHCFEFFY